MNDSLRQLTSELSAALQGSCAVYYENLQTGATYEYRGSERFPAASVIKLPILVEAGFQAASGELYLETLVSVHESRKAGGSGILRDLHSGLQVTVRDLLTLMVILSDNTATNMVIDLVGMERVNARCRALGLEETLLRRKLMGGPFYERPDYSLDIDNYLSAHDIGTLLVKLACHQLINPEMDELLLDIMRRQQVNDRLPALLPRGARVAHKTGEFQTTRHDAGIIYPVAGPAYILVLLTRDLKDTREAVVQLAKFSRRVYDMVTQGY